MPCLTPGQAYLLKGHVAFRAGFANGGHDFLPIGFHDPFKLLGGYGECVDLPAFGIPDFDFMGVRIYQVK